MYEQYRHALPPQQNPQQEQRYAQAQPIVVGQTAEPSSSPWKSALWWVGSIVASTIIVYYVNKAIHAHEKKKAEAKEENPGPYIPEIAREDSTINLGRLFEQQERLSKQVADVHSWIAKQGESKLKAV